MKRYLAPFVVTLALVAAHCFAREPQAPPSPVESSAQTTYSLKRNTENAGENIFVGHFGETVRLAHFWAVDAKMHGPMEAVNFHLKTLDPLGNAPPFNPKPKDYVPENFKRLRLMQMLVIPKDVPGGFQSLAKLREAKAKELNATGSGYELQEVGDYPWPPDSFQVSISTPYRLYQLYTQSDKNFFIITSGAGPHDVNPDDPILTNATADLTNSLSTHLDDFRLKIMAEKNFPYDLRIIAIPWAAICGLAALLSFLPKRRNWLARLRLMGRTMFSLTTAWLLLAGSVLFASWRLGLQRIVNEGSILVCAGLITPWICRTISIRLGGQRPWRVFTWSAMASIFSVLAGVLFHLDYAAGTILITGLKNFWRMSCVLSILGFFNGIAFGLSHHESGQPKPSGSAS